MNGSLYGSIAQSGSAKKIKNAALAGLVFLLHAYTAPIEIILRSKFGERYMSAGLILFNVLLAWASYFSAPMALKPFMWMMPLILLAGVVSNSILCFKRDRRGEYWHSYSDGESRIRVPALDRFLSRRNYSIDGTKMILEPLVVFLMAVLGFILLGMMNVDTQRITYSSPLARFVLVLTSYFSNVWIMLIIYQLILFQHRREFILDGKDAAFEAAGMMRNSSGKASRLASQAKVKVPDANAVKASDWTV